MPCHPARARELVRSKRAIRRFNRGIFYIKLLDREDGVTQPVVVGIDPGSKKEGFTVKSASHTYINIQADAVTWVKLAVKIRREMRCRRRCRKTPYRACRTNRSVGGISPSTKARWQWKLRICTWLARMFPITHFVVEDTRALPRPGARKWNSAFSPLARGKTWFYQKLEELAPLSTLRGYETKELRDTLGLVKSSSKLSEVFSSHCVDSWVLANWRVGGHITPDSTRLLCITPIQFHRRQLHALQPSKGGTRRPYGGTRSLGLKRGEMVKHPVHGVTYVGGVRGKWVSLHRMSDGERVSRTSKPSDCKRLAYASWRTRLLPNLATRSSRVQEG